MRARLGATSKGARLRRVRPLERTNRQPLYAPFGMLAVFGVALKDCDKVFRVFAESTLLLSSTMKDIGRSHRPVCRF
jgi:hypothetical protein